MLEDNLVTKGVTLRFTPEVYRKAKDGSTSHCLIAESIRHSIPGARDPKVNDKGIRFVVGNTRYSMFHTDTTKRIATAFDAGLKPKANSLRVRAGQLSPVPVNFRGPLAQKRKPNKPKSATAKAKACKVERRKWDLKGVTVNKGDFDRIA